MCDAAAQVELLSDEDNEKSDAAKTESSDKANTAKGTHRDSESFLDQAQP